MYNNNNNNTKKRIWNRLAFHRLQSFERISPFFGEWHRKTRSKLCWIHPNNIYLVKKRRKIVPKLFVKISIGAFKFLCLFFDRAKKSREKIPCIQQTGIGFGCNFFSLDNFWYIFFIRVVSSNAEVVVVNDFGNSNKLEETAMGREIN